MGQKVHPIGLRLGINRNWNSIWFNKIKSNNYFNNLWEDLKIRKYIKGKLKILGYLNSLIKIYKKKNNLLLVTGSVIKSSDKVLKKRWSKKLLNYININKFFKKNKCLKSYYDKYINNYKINFKYKKYKKKEKNKNYWIKKKKYIYLKKNKIRKLKIINNKLKKFFVKKNFLEDGNKLKFNLYKKKNLFFKVLNNKNVIKNINKNYKLNLGLNILKKIKNLKKK